MNPLKKTTRILTALAGWTGFALLMVVNVRAVRAEAGMTFLNSILRSLTYFTVLTNLLVIMGVTIPLLWPQKRAGRFFTKPHVLSGILVYIVIVGLVYLVVLARTWNPQGIHRIADVLQHYVVPILFLLHWISLPKGKLEWKNVPLWLAFPSVYFAFTMARGAFTGFYPYPFIDVTQLGILQVLINTVMIACGFALFGLAAVAVDSLLGRTRLNRHPDP